MKNLLKTSTIAVVILSLFAVSCDKPKAGDIPVPPPENGASTTWTPKDSKKPITTKSDIKNGDVGVVYTIVPNQPVCGNCPGTWVVTIVATPNAQWVSLYSAKDGSVGFNPRTPGTYTITMTYKSACAPDVVIVVTITVSR